MLSRVTFCRIKLMLLKHFVIWFLVFLTMETSQASEINLSGKANMGGQDMNFTMTLSESGMFANKITGYQSMQTGFDGESFWRIEEGAGPFEVDFSEREVWILIHWVLSGYWLHENAPIIWRKDAATGNAIMRLEDGRLEVLTTSSFDKLRSAPDKKRHRVIPEILTIINLPQELTVRFNGRQQLMGLNFPKQVLITGIGEVEKFEFLSAKSTDKYSPQFYKKPPFQANNVHFEKNTMPEVEIKQTKSGHIFVKPLINGEQFGWFLFDSGAGGSMLKQEIIDKFNFTRVATSITGGIGGIRGKVNVYKGGELKLGPLSIKNLNYKVYDPSRSMASKLLGEPVVGVLGWDILIRATVEIDMLKARMWIYDPDEYRIPEGSRQRLFLHWKVPYAEATFAPNHTGMFMLDTGAGKSGIFFTHFSVKTLSLLKGKDGKQSNAQGAGGKIPIIKGNIDWFEIHGHKTKNASAIFSIGDDHEADIFSTGFLGGAVIKPFKVVFDYRRNEIGLIKRH